MGLRCVAMFNSTLSTLRRCDGVGPSVTVGPRVHSPPFSYSIGTPFNAKNCYYYLNVLVEILKRTPEIVVLSTVYVEHNSCHFT